MPPGQYVRICDFKLTDVNLGCAVSRHLHDSFSTDWRNVTCTTLSARTMDAIVGSRPNQEEKAARLLRYWLGVGSHLDPFWGFGSFGVDPGLFS